MIFWHILQTFWLSESVTIKTTVQKNNNKKNEAVHLAWNQFSFDASSWNTCVYVWLYRYNHKTIIIAFFPSHPALPLVIRSYAGIPSLPFISDWSVAALFQLLLWPLDVLIKNSSVLIFLCDRKQSIVSVQCFMKQLFHWCKYLFSLIASNKRFIILKCGILAEQIQPSTSGKTYIRFPLN